MMVLKYVLALGILSLTFACGINSVTRAQLEKVKAGDVVTYRYQKNGKSWFYADKVTRIEGDKIYYNPSSQESTAGNDDRIRNYDTSRELSIEKSEFLKYETEQGDERKVVIWIN